MADKGIKGITVTIGADTGPLSKALGDVNAKSRDLQSELRQVERLLKLDPENVTLLAQKQTLLAESTENAAEKLKRLKDVQKQVTEQFKSGDLGEEQFRAYQREVEGAKVALKDTGDEAKGAGKHIDDAGKKAEKSGDNAKSGAQKWEKLGSAVKTAAGFAVKAVAALGTAVTAAGGALVKTAIGGAQYADDLATMAQQTGVAADTLQKLQYASELVDVPVEKVTGSLAKLTKNMLSAQQWHQY